MQRIPSEFLVVLVLVSTLSGCRTYRTFENSGVLNTMAIELDDENVTYQRLESQVARESFGGFLPRPPQQGVVEATILSNNNGSTQVSQVNPSGANFLAALTLLANMSISGGTMFAVERAGIVFLLTSVVGGLALNEWMWRPIHRRRIQAETLQLALRENPDADFYGFPHSEFQIQPSLFSTQWNASQRIVAGNISEQIIPNASTGALGSSGSEVNGSAPTLRGTAVRAGATGTYDGTSAKVLEVLNVEEGNPEFQLVIVAGDAEPFIIESTDVKFVLD